MSDTYNILSPELTVQALRDSGYRNTAYAIAELIDNSIDAGADEGDHLGLLAGDGLRDVADHGDGRHHAELARRLASRR